MDPESIAEPGNRVKGVCAVDKEPARCYTGVVNERCCVLAENILY
jgi:hypothetical protein